MMKTRTKVFWGVTATGVLLVGIFLSFGWLERGGPAGETESAGPSFLPSGRGDVGGGSGHGDGGGPSDAFSSIDEILEKMLLANLAFNAPQSMNLHDTAMIQLMLGIETNVDELKRMITAEGEKEGARIQVSNRMEARLTGSNFLISTVTPEIQAVSRSGVTE